MITMLNQSTAASMVHSEAILAITISAQDMVLILDRMDLTPAIQLEDLMLAIHQEASILDLMDQTMVALEVLHQEDMITTLNQLDTELLLKAMDHLILDIHKVDSMQAMEVLLKVMDHLILDIHKVDSMQVMEVSRDHSVALMLQQELAQEDMIIMLSQLDMATAVDFQAIQISVPQAMAGKFHPMVLTTIKESIVIQQAHHQEAVMKPHRTHHLMPAREATVVTHTKSFLPIYPFTSFPLFLHRIFIY
jgi:hypothetical protein